MSAHRHYYDAAQRGLGDGEARRKYKLVKCPHCGRICKCGKWIRPIGRDLREIEDNYYATEIIDRVCPRCKEQGGYIAIIVQFLIVAFFTLAGAVFVGCLLGQCVIRAVEL